MVTKSQLPLIKGPIKNTLQPRFLSLKDDHLLDTAINFFEQFVGLSPNDISKEEFLSIIVDYKVALLLFETLKKNFFKSSLKRSQADTQLLPEQISDLRLEFWKFVNQQTNGIVNSESQRSKIIDAFHKLKENSLSNQFCDIPVENLLFHDYETHHVIYKLKKISPAHVRQEFNKRLVKTLLKYSQSLKISIPSDQSLSSVQIKNLFYLTRRFGLFTHVERINNKIIVEIIGSQELIGRNTKYGKSIERVLINLLKKTESEEAIKNWKFIIKIPYRSRSKEIIISLPEKESFTSLFGVHHDFKDELSFDSELERQFYQILTSFKDWKVEREPVIIIGQEIILPDFVLSLKAKTGIKVYIEVVGFWTESYLKKKIVKLTRLKDKLPPFIILADHKLNFPIIESMMTFYYKSNEIRRIAGSLEQRLKRKYIDSFNKKQLKEIDTDIQQYFPLIDEGFDTAPIIRPEHLCEIFQVNDYFQLVPVLEKKYKEFALKDWKFISKLGLVQNKDLNGWKNHVNQKFKKSNTFELPFSVFYEVLPNFDQGDILNLLNALDYKVRYTNLSNIHVYLPKKQQLGNKIGN